MWTNFNIRNLEKVFQNLTSKIYYSLLHHHQNPTWGKPTINIVSFLIIQNIKKLKILNPRATWTPTQRKERKEEADRSQDCTKLDKEIRQSKQSIDFYIFLRQHSHLCQSFTLEYNFYKRSRNPLEKDKKKWMWIIWAHFLFLQSKLCYQLSETSFKTVMLYREWFKTSEGC